MDVYLEWYDYDRGVRVGDPVVVKGGGQRSVERVMLGMMANMRPGLIVREVPNEVEPTDER